MPWLYNLRTDPYEKASITSNTYWDWYIDHVFLLVPAQDWWVISWPPLRTIHPGKRRPVSRLMMRWSENAAEGMP
jgi:hypothetical protein